jgi:hypothetical protein
LVVQTFALHADAPGEAGWPHTVGDELNGTTYAGTTIAKIRPVASGAVC